MQNKSSNNVYNVKLLSSLEEVILLEQGSDNPVTNCLGKGLDEKLILNAIEKSGYPLQTVVGNTLRNNFGVIEEWCYID